jgi:hypothetical protein
MQQRKYTRVPFTGNAELTTEKPPIKVDISNISLGGLHLHCPNLFNLGERLALRIQGVCANKSFSENVEGRVVVVYRRPDGNSYGLQFFPSLDLSLHPGLYRWVDDAVGKTGATSFLRNVPTPPPELE